MHLKRAINPKKLRMKVRISPAATPKSVFECLSLSNALFLFGGIFGLPKLASQPTGILSLSTYYTMELAPTYKCTYRSILPASAHIVLFLEMQKYSNLTFLKEQVFFEGK
jgi:hypothetical protein